MRKLAIINNCKQCPHCTTDRTPGAGCATDYLCKLSKPEHKDKYRPAAKYRLIAGYVESSREEPQDGEFPEWCPLYEAEPGMYEQS